MVILAICACIGIVLLLIFLGENVLSFLLCLLIIVLVVVLVLLLSKRRS